MSCRFSSGKGNFSMQRGKGCRKPPTSGTRIPSMITLLIMGILICLATPTRASAPAGEWWSANYGLRKKITITAGSTNVPIGYSVSFSENTANLITNSKLRSDGKDWRVVYWNGSTWVQLDRWVDDIIGDGWNSANTITWFKTQAGITAASFDDNYYVYYGYAGETLAAPAYMSDSMGADAASKVFWYADDFEEHAASTDPDGWTDQGTEDFKVMLHGSEKWFQTQTSNNWMNGSTASSMSNIGNAVWSAKLYYHQAGTNSWGGIGVHIANGGVGRIVVVRDGAYYHADEAWVAGAWVANTDIHFPLGSKGRIELVANGTNLDAYWYNPSGYSPEKVVLFTGYTMLSGTGKLGVYVERPWTSLGNNRWIDADDIIVRQYVTPEPTSGVGAEEVAPISLPFSYRKAITIDRTRVSCASMTDFPVLIKITADNNLKTTANGGRITNSNGYDIIFRDSDGITTLDHEIEQYNGSTGDLIAWVKVPGITNTADKVIYMYYGNSGVTSPTQDPNRVWDTNYEAVWHLKEDPSGTVPQMRDSTVNARHGTSAGSMPSTASVTGKIDGSLLFDNVNDRIDTSNFTGGLSQMTAEAWVFKADTTGDDRMVAKSSDTNLTPNYIWSLGVAGNIIRVRLATGGAAPTSHDSATISANTWAHLAFTYDGANIRIYKDGALQTTTAKTGVVNSGTQVVVVANNDNIPNDRYWNGQLDEVRMSNIARSTCWIQTEYNNQNSPATFYTVGTEQSTPPTSVDLLSLSARGEGNRVVVEWSTAQELENLGFHLYRAASLGGPYTRITDKVIAGMTFSSMGRSYSYVDGDVTRGKLYYYKLEDIDIFGKKTMHGPVCVDWDGDGMPDDWETAHGSNPGVPDGHLDSDGDGLSNLQEYQRNGKTTEVSVVAESQTLGKGVEVISSDKDGMTLELRTGAFDAESVQAGGVTYQRLRVPEYIHGYTSEVGKPELPVKGVILDVPDGKTARVWVEGTESQVYPGYRVYPVPEKVVFYEDGTERVVETFMHRCGGVRDKWFVPGEVAQTGESYTFRGQEKKQLLFYPLQFNPGTGELVHHSRIRVRVAYEGSGAVAFAKSMAPAPAVNPMAKALAWAPPSLTTPAYKVKVEEEGMYRLTKGWLESRGVDVSTVVLSQVRMYNLGQEVAIGVSDQDGDDAFDAEDYIEFYCQKAPSPQSKYARHNVYWLTTSGGSGAALRMGSIDGSPGSGSNPSHPHLYSS